MVRSHLQAQGEWETVSKIATEMMLAFEAADRWVTYQRLHEQPDYEIESEEALYLLNSVGDSAAAGIVTVDNLDVWLNRTIEWNVEYQMERQTIDYLSSKLVAECARSGGPYTLYQGGNDLRFEQWQATAGEELGEAFARLSGNDFDDVETNLVLRAVRDSDYTSGQQSAVLERAQEICDDPDDDLDWYGRDKDFGDALGWYHLTTAIYQTRGN